TVADLQELGAELMSFYGQHEHRRLMLQTAQLDLLDSYCGEPQARLRDRLHAAYGRARELEARAAELRELAGHRERELDLVSFELTEIEAADPSVEEEAELSSERERLRHLEALQRAAAGAAEAIAPESGDGARELLGGAAYELESVAAIDPALSGLAQRLEAVRYEAEDIAVELRGYLQDVTGEAAAGERLEEVEARLAVFARLQRKHGGEIEEVLAHAKRCRARRDELEHADQALESAEHELAGARGELELLAGEIGDARRTAAPGLAAAVRDRLAELSMPDARFEIELGPRPDGCGPRGADSIEMQIAANAGGALAPLREVASGGELSRIMLALMSVAESEPAAARDVAPLLVFDEIDAGIGGHTARAVGEHLRGLSERRQILCITHLPQVAALAQRHFAIVKQAGTEPATTTVTMLEGDGVVGELVRMLGAGSDDGAASEHARELLRAA
ncbi:MAG TPA: hypothetical protein VN880_13805, partial [Solirubrobacteraceae bacterium]|nr:hypothetical protein [Solirubrobacteraceae bacterium]